MVWAIILVIASFLFLANPAWAVTIDVSDVPSSITDQSFTVDISITGAGAGTNYLRVDLYKDGTTNYFGETYNNSSWYNGSSGTSYYPITIVSGQTWTGSVQGRAGSPTATEYPGSESYKLKVRRYTSSGNLASSDTQTPKDVTINLSSSSSPTPSPSSVSSSFAISNLPSTIDSTETFTVKVSLSLPDDPSTSFYLKGAFKKEGSSNYFGLTKVSSSWVKNGSSSSNQYKLTTDSNGSWSGNLDIQPDILDSGYEGSGSYIFKVGRYSSSGAGPTWSNEASITINAKEVSGGEDNENINLSNISSKSKKSLTSKSEDIPDLPEEVYSLENYKKNATIAGATSASPSPNTLVKEERQVNWFFVLGGLLVITGVGPLVYIFIKSRVKSLD